MATIIPFPVTKLPPAEERPLGLIDADRLGRDRGRIVTLSDYRVARQPHADWRAYANFNLNLCLE